jgi:hypothetical protein
MSTIDSPAVRAVGRPRPGPGAAVLLVIGLIATAALWCVFGYGAADAIRFPVGAKYLPAELFPGNVPSLGLALFGGVIGGSVLGFVVQIPLIRAFGLGVGACIVFAVGFVCTAAGFFAGASASWVPAPEPGSFAAAAGQAGEAWGAGAWVAWASRYWLPALLILIGLLTILVALGNRRRQGRRRDRLMSVTETGRKLPGVVVETTDTGTEVMGMPRVRFTVRFTDDLGTERRVTKTNTFDRTRLPRAGDPVVVWFDLSKVDPSNPDDPDSNPVGLGTPEQVAEILRA